MEDGTEELRKRKNDGRTKEILEKLWLPASPLDE